MGLGPGYGLKRHNTRKEMIVFMKKFLSLCFCLAALLSLSCPVFADQLLLPRVPASQPDTLADGSRQSGLLRPRRPTPEAYSNAVYEAFGPALNAIGQAPSGTAAASPAAAAQVYDIVNTIRRAYRKAAELTPAEGHDDVQSALRKTAGLLDTFCLKYRGLQAGQAGAIRFFSSESQLAWSAHLNTAAGELSAALARLPDAA